MTEVRQKLAHCFSIAFPKMDPGDYATASAGNTAAWDSVAQVTLLSLIGEEFGVDIDFEQFEGATSFEAIAERLERSSASA
ncbi:MAG TPA: acyl carrier protein [Bryobacteraceae bacterium]|nr:acyl carrier protein [Bryobacteraceae bacterium]